MRRVLKGMGSVLALLVLALVSQHLRLGATEALPPPDDNLLRVASFNVHYIVLGADAGRWSEAGWQARRGAVDAAFKALEADIVAFQEMESFQRGSDGSVNLARDFLLAQNPAYGVAASGDWRSFPPTQPVFYRKDRVTPEDQGWFFFSETPDVIYSRTFNGSYPAFASWVRFATPQGPVWVVNLHVDAFSRDNRRRSIALVAERVAPMLAQGAVIVAGDFNALARSPLLRPLKQQGLVFPRAKASFHFDKGLHLFGAIDHIGFAGLAAARGPYVVQSRFDGVFPADHYPVVTDFQRPTD